MVQIMMRDEAVSDGLLLYICKLQYFPSDVYDSSRENSKIYGLICSLSDLLQTMILIFLCTIGLHERNDVERGLQADSQYSMAR